MTSDAMPILHKNRMCSGIADLDIILEGGYRNPGNIMINGPTGSEKAALAYHFAASAGPSETSYIICGNSAPQNIMDKAAGMGINLNKSNIIFIDCYSATLGKEPPESERIKVVPGPAALNDLSLALNEGIAASSGKKMRIVFDTLSTFVLYNPQDSIRKFLSVIEGRLKTANATTIFLVDEGVHDKQLVSLLEQGMDDILKIADKGGKHSLILPDVEVEVPIRVGPSGIIIV